MDQPSVKFVVAVYVVAIALLLADRYASEFFFSFGSVIAAHYVFKAFAWALFSGAVLAATQSPRD
jgi:hypothetical protein